MLSRCDGFCCSEYGAGVGCGGVGGGMRRVVGGLRVAVFGCLGCTGTWVSF